MFNCTKRFYGGQVQVANLCGESEKKTWALTQLKRLAKNIRLGCKCFIKSNTLAYSINVLFWKSVPWIVLMEEDQL